MVIAESTNSAKASSPILGQTGWDQSVPVNQEVSIHLTH
jgi:hypothetical protein